MSYKRNKKAEKKAQLEEFDAMMEKMKKIADNIVNDMDPERMKHLCRTFLTVALGTYSRLDEDSVLLNMFDLILKSVNIHIHVNGEEN